MNKGSACPQTNLTVCQSWAVPAGLMLWVTAPACRAASASVFVETGLLVGLFLPGDTLLFFTGVVAFSGVVGQPQERHPHPGIL